MISQLVSCWHIMLSNGEQILYTDHADKIIIDELMFENSKEFSIIGSAINITNSAEADSMAIAINFTAESKWFMQTAFGNFDNAQVMHYKINILHDIDKKLLVFKGYIKEITLAQFSLIAIIKSVKSKLEESSIGEFYSPYCRANFGDMRCKVEKDQYTLRNTIKTIIDSHTFSLENPIDTSKFIPNTLSSQKPPTKDIKILYMQNDIVTLKDHIPSQICKGDEVFLYLMCDNKYETCHKVFNNIKNFRGEPFIL